MILYMDASAIVAIVAREPTSAAVDEMIRSGSHRVVASDFAIAESSAAIARIGRIRLLRIDEIDELFAELDDWVFRFAEMVRIASEDVDRANDLVRLHALKLRSPDAIHLAAAARLNTTLITLDRAMTRAANTLDLPCIIPADPSAT